MHEKNIALLCDEADRLLQLNINLLRQMVDEPDVLLDGKNENGLLFDKRKALKRIEKINPTTAILNTDGRKKTTRKNLPPRRRALLTSTARMSAIGISTSILSPAMMNVFSSEFQ